jgi:hypothetical protein
MVHGMTGRELDALCASDERLAKVNPNDDKDDADLADWICEELALRPKPAPAATGRTRVRAEEPAADDDTQRRLEEMRRRRG